MSSDEGQRPGWGGKGLAWRAGLHGGGHAGRVPPPSWTVRPLFSHGFCAQLCLELPKLEDRARWRAEPRDPLPRGLVLGSALWEFQLH